MNLVPLGRAQRDKLPLGEGLYQLLKLSPSAAQADIEKAWKRAAAKWHPDREFGHSEVFEECRYAYEVLSNTRTRYWYDKHKIAVRIEECNQEAKAEFPGFLEAMVNELTENEVPTNVNFIHSAQQQMRQQSAEIQNQIEKLAKKVERLVRQTKRLKHKRGESQSVLAHMVTRAVTKLKHTQTMLMRQTLKLEATILLLGEYECEVQQSKPTNVFSTANSKIYQHFKL